MPKFQFVTLGCVEGFQRKEVFSRFGNLHGCRPITGQWVSSLAKIEPATSCFRSRCSASEQLRKACPQSYHICWVLSSEALSICWVLSSEELSTIFKKYWNIHAKISLRRCCTSPSWYPCADIPHGEWHLKLFLGKFWLCIPQPSMFTIIFSLILAVLLVK